MIGVREEGKYRYLLFYYGRIKSREFINSIVSKWSNDLVSHYLRSKEWKTRYWRIEKRAWNLINCGNHGNHFEISFSCNTQFSCNICRGGSVGRKICKQ